MLHGFLVFLHVVVSFLLVVTVLLQSGKGGGLSGTFGGGGGVTGGVFGGRGAAPLLVKATTVFAVLFMLTAVSLNFVKPGARSSSVIERVVPNAPQGSQPAVPGQAPGQSPVVPGPGTPGQAPSGGAQ